MGFVLQQYFQHDNDTDRVIPLLLLCTGTKVTLKESFQLIEILKCHFCRDNAQLQL